MAIKKSPINILNILLLKNKFVKKKSARCVNCGITLAHLQNRSYHCSPECKRVYLRRYWRNWYRALRDKTKNEIYQKPVVNEEEVNIDQIHQPENNNSFYKSPYEIS